jgi:hypothetical protein
VIRDLGDGLILRRATTADAEPLAAFNAEVHRETGMTGPHEPIERWVRDLMLRPHPTVGPGDFMLVEEGASGRIVSSLNLISQTWTYGGLPFEVGQIELVGTHPDYRRRGLIRQQFEVVHEWSRERGQLVQSISGIPWYYRQFGYEYALELGGGRSIGAAQVRPLESGHEPFRLRAATEEDAAFLAEVDAAANRRYLVACTRDEALWRYELTGVSERSQVKRTVQVIETASGQPAGFVAHGWELSRGALGVERVELRPGLSWAATLPGILRALVAIGSGLARADDPCASIALALGSEHPSYRFLPAAQPQVIPSYAWYLRIADLPAFVRHVAPAIEANLADSPAAGHTGRLRLGFYRASLHLSLESGRLTAVETAPFTDRRDYDLLLPDLTFLQMLFGYRSFAALHAAFPDATTRHPEAAALLDCLFPKRLSSVWSMA